MGNWNKHGKQTEIRPRSLSLSHSSWCLTNLPFPANKSMGKFQPWPHPLNISILSLQAGLGLFFEVGRTRSLFFKVEEEEEKKEEEEEEEGERERVQSWIERRLRVLLSATLLQITTHLRANERGQSRIEEKREDETRWEGTITVMGTSIYSRSGIRPLTKARLTDFVSVLASVFFSWDPIIDNLTRIGPWFTLIEIGNLLSWVR